MAGCSEEGGGARRDRGSPTLIQHKRSMRFTSKNYLGSGFEKMDFRSEIWDLKGFHVQLGSEDARQIRQRLRGCPSCECPAQQIVESEKKNRQIVESAGKKKVVEATAEE